MFRKHEEKPEVFVPKFYVKVVYDHSKEVMTRTYDNEEHAVRVRDDILADIDSKAWVEVDGDIIRSESVIKVSVKPTRRRGNTDTGWP